MKIKEYNCIVASEHTEYEHIIYEHIVYGHERKGRNYGRFTDN